MKPFVALVLLVGCLGGAAEAYGAEAPPPTVSVQGGATVPISKTASPAEALATFHNALAAAITAGHEKAEFLADQTEAKVGAIQQISEDGGEISCELRAEAGPLSEYVPYEGATPDFGSFDRVGVPQAAAPTAAVAPAPLRKKRKRNHKPKAKKAGTTVCTLSTHLFLTYLLT